MTQTHNENIETSDINEIVSTRFSDYSKYVNISRAIPNAMDGLKPVQRRILYSMTKSGITHNKPYKKSAKAVGEVMGTYHPHGDCLRGDTLVTLLNGTQKTMEELYKEGKEVEILAVDKDNNIVPSVAHSFRIGQHTDTVYSIALSNGQKIEMTGNHPVLLYSEGKQIWEKTENLNVGDLLFSGSIEGTKPTQTFNKSKSIKITSIELQEVEQEPMYDFTVDTHENMLLIQGDTFIVVHNSSIYGAMVRLSKDWVMPIPLIDMQGNNGSIDGDSPASMRYTEARLSKVVTDYITKGITKKGLTEMTLNYDDSEEEPVILPVFLPLLLLMGVKGIGVAYSTSIPTFNLTEVMKTAIEILKHPNITDDELSEILIAPDFPTGAVITNGKTLKNILSKGNGRIPMRSDYRVVKSGKNKNKIIFSDIPYDTNKSEIMIKLNDIIDSKSVNGLLSVTDIGENDDVEIEVEVEADADVNVILGYLYKNTSLQKNYNINMVVIHENKPQQLGVFDIIREFNKFRKENQIKESTIDLKEQERRLEIVDGFIKLSSIIQEVIVTIQKSKGRKNSIDNIMKEYDFTQLQAENIVGLALHRLSKTDADEFIEEKKDIERRIEILNKLLTNDKFLTKLLIKQYTEIIKTYGYDRRTKVIMEDEDWTVRKTDVIQEEDTFVGISKEGYIKRANRRSFNTTAKNGLIEGDSEVVVEETTTKQFALIFLSNGTYVYLPVHEIEETRWGDVGKHLSTYIDIGAETTIVNAFIVDEEEDKDKLVLTVKKDGLVKKTTLEEHKVLRYFSVYEAIKMEEDNELILAELLDPTKEYNIAFEESDKKTLTFNLNEVLPKGLRTKGMRGIHVRDGNYVKDVKVYDGSKNVPKKYKEGKRGGRTK